MVQVMAKLLVVAMIAVVVPYPAIGDRGESSVTGVASSTGGQSTRAAAAGPSTSEPPVLRRYQVVRDNAPLLVYPRPCQQSQPLPNITLPRCSTIQYLEGSSTSSSCNDGFEWGRVSLPGSKQGWVQVGIPDPGFSCGAPFVAAALTDLCSAAYTKGSQCRTIAAPSPVQMRQYSCACAAPTLDAAGNPVQILSGSSILFPAEQTLATCSNEGDNGCYAYVIFNNIAGWIPVGNADALGTCPPPALGTCGPPPPDTPEPVAVPAASGARKPSPICISLPPAVEGQQPWDPFCFGAKNGSICTTSCKRPLVGTLSSICFNGAWSGVAGACSKDPLATGRQVQPSVAALLNKELVFGVAPGSQAGAAVLMRPAAHTSQQQAVAPTAKVAG